MLTECFFTCYSAEVESLFSGAAFTMKKVTVLMESVRNGSDVRIFSS